METLVIYFAKANFLLIIFFLAYHFLLRKETFFNSNRWFLLAGLGTSMVLPALFIKKFISVPKPEFIPEQFVAYTPTTIISPASAPIENPLSWTELLLGAYTIIALVLLAKILINLFSLFRLLYKKEIIRRGTFALVDIDENISPFSFFNYIVFNSNYYTNEELQSILLHEKVHSQERHSIDVLMARIFSILFWFNPFIWLYKKAMIQNLEFIADHKASQLFEDKKIYQKALVKVVAQQNCLAITNHFNASLIKNRIVMLNKSQSQKKNSWKYALILPALTAFMFFFQVKTIAQEIISRNPQSGLYITTDKNSSNEEMKNDAKVAKEKFGVTIKYSKIKRNTKGEITAIKIEYKDANGKTGMTQIQDDEPIKPIYFHKTRDKIGFGKTNEIRIAHHLNDNDEKNFGFSFFEDDKNAVTEIEKIIIPDAPDAPEVLEEIEKIEVPLAPLAPESMDAPKAPKMKSFNKSIIIKRQNDGKPEIIVNGKKLDADSEEYKKMTEDFDGKFEFKMDENGPMVFKFNDEEAFDFKHTDIDKITKEALENSKIQMKKMRERMQKMRGNNDNMKIEIEKIKPEDFNFNFNWDDKENSDADMKKTREEMMKAREEMLKARDEMLKAKEEMLKAKTQTKTKKA